MITLYGLGVVDIIRRQGGTRILATCLAIVAVLDSDSWRKDMMAAQRTDERKSEKPRLLPYLRCTELVVNDALTASRGLTSRRSRDHWYMY